MLHYSLDVESQSSLLNIDTFSTPFDYKLKIATSSAGETKDTNIDLVETFNYLLGLVVKRIELLKGYLVVEGQNFKKEKILIIWRDGQRSDELNEFFKKMDWSVYDREFDTIYVNGDNNLANLKKDEDHFKVKLIEQEFKRLMFNE
jgi:adenine-specific DNA-methyltransferase